MLILPPLRTKELGEQIAISARTLKGIAALHALIMLWTKLISNLYLAPGHQTRINFMLLDIFERCGGFEPPIPKS